MLNIIHISGPNGGLDPISRRAIERVMWKHFHIIKSSAAAEGKGPWVQSERDTVLMCALALGGVA